VTAIIHNITFDSANPRSLAAFWGEVTGWPVDYEPQPGYSDCAVRPPDGTGPKLYFVQVPEGKVGKNRVHLDVVPADRTQDEEIARLVALGASVLSDRRPEVGWVILADPAGNEFCVEMSRAEFASAMAAEGSAE
jgi:predicted enzyme related to lactoylglutathione lyase